MSSGEERWLPVVGYEKSYEVSDKGRVRSIDRVIIDCWGRTRRLRGKFLSPNACSDPPYPAVRISRGEGVSEIVRIHVLMAAAFIGPRPPGHEVRHLDDDKSNNTLGNLAYGTSSENTLDMVRNGNHNHARKTQCKRGHEFTPENTYGLQHGRRTCKRCALDRSRKSVA